MTAIETHFDTPEVAEQLPSSTIEPVSSELMPVEATAEDAESQTPPTTMPPVSVGRIATERALGSGLVSRGAPDSGVRYLGRSQRQPSVTPYSPAARQRQMNLRNR